MAFFEKKANEEAGPHHPPQPLELPLSPEGVEQTFGDSGDFVSREVFVGGQAKFKVKIFYIDGMVGGQWVSEQILEPITENPMLADCQSASQLFERLLGGVNNFEAKVHENINTLSAAMITGSCAVLVPGEKKALSFEAKGFQSRSVTEPSDENVIKGAKDCFIENVRVNTALVRRRLKTPHLRIIESPIGRQTMTTLGVVYIEGLSNPELVDEVRRRIADIDIDGALLAGYVEEYLEDSSMSPFPQMIYTERCDRFCHGILGGQVGLLIDGMPLAYLLPTTFAQLMKAPEDYANNYILASCITVLRYVAFYIALLLPGFYLAVVIFHQEMIPPSLAASIIASKKDVPFGSALEVLGMLMSFEILLEAGLRLPKVIGQAISIMGAMVVGQAAVEAKIVSPAVVIVIALTGISGFVMPNQDFSGAVRLMRFAFVLLAAFLGLAGLAVGMTLMLYHMASLESFGVAYFSPFSKDKPVKALSRGLFRAPLRSMKEREETFGPQNRRNQK